MATKYNSNYIPAFFKAFSESKPVVATYSDFNLTDSNHGNTGSFKYDPLGSPLKSTQQLNVDWTKFENHCFFSSAEVKVNEAFNKIVNSYPFDGTKKEVEQYMDTLTGFEKWVFDSFPRWSGALHFSGTQAGEDPSGGYSAGLGNWISVKDKSGNLYPEISKNNKGDVVINPEEDASLSIEMLLKLPQTTNGTQVVFQKASSNVDGFMLHLDATASTDAVNAVFSISSGSYRNSVDASIKKGAFNHLCVVLDKNDAQKQNLKFFVNETLVSTSKNYVNFSKLSIDSSDLLIGSGSSFYVGQTLVTPTQTLSGTMDEFKVYHSSRDVAQQKLNIKRGSYATSDLKLYYRFNEPSGSLSLNNDAQVDSIVLDSSGNSLHSVVKNFQFNRRVNVSSLADNVMIDEKEEFKVVLFPAYADVISLNIDLLAEAKSYDRSNPNTIFKLIPPHYLLEGAVQDGFENPDGNGGNPYGGSGIPGKGEKGSVQIILTFLYIWAKFFDEIKIYLDSFATLKTVSYDLNDTVPDNFLEDMIRSYGIYLPKFFSHSTLEQFAEGQNVDGLTDSKTPLKKIQAIITRRVLINMLDIMRSKGTKHSIKSFLRSVGIDPENSIRIREYGGPTTKQITTSREKRMESIAFVQFDPGSLIATPFLTASRVEPGYPQPVGSFKKDSLGRNTGTTNSSDGLLTSGSWNIEAVFKMPPQRQSLITADEGNQSLFRIVTTGSSPPVGYSDPALIANVVVTQQNTFSNKKATIKAYIRPGFVYSDPVLSMSIDMPGKGFFDGDKWNVSLGCIRGDELGTLSSSYYLRIGKVESGELSETYETSSFFSPGSGNVFRQKDQYYNASGSQIRIGNETINDDVVIPFLNDTLTSDPIARTAQYVGWASSLRFWSKSMSLNEWKEHVINPRSVGVDDPLKNYNFTKNISGSFAKLRLDTLQKQPTKTSDATGSIAFVDYSLNFSNVYTNGVGFATSSNVLLGDFFDYSYLSPMFDEMSTDDKIRIRSYQDPQLVDASPWAVTAPSYLSQEIMVNEEPQDDTRLSIEFSMIDSLDRDMISMFSSLDFMSDAIGSPELMFSPDYPDLDRLRDVYFNRLSGKPNFKKFFEFYRWFDVSISSFIQQLIPSKTAYKGTNYVVESHMLERHKNSYRHSENYLGEKQIIQDSLLVQQIVGKLNKY